MRLNYPFRLFTTGLLLSAGALLMLLLVLGTVPALIIYWVIHPHSPGMSLAFAVYSMSAGTGLLYYVFNKDQFPFISDRILFFAGALLAPAGAAKILSCS